MNVQELPETGNGWPPDRVADLRMRVRMNQTAFGRALGVTRQTVGEWERGDSEPSRLNRRALDELAAQFGPVASPAVAEPPAAYSALRSSLAYWLGRLEEAGGVLDDAAVRHRRIRDEIREALGAGATPVDDRARAVQSSDAAVRARAEPATEDAVRPRQRRA